MIIHIFSCDDNTILTKFLKLAQKKKHLYLWSSS
jgi:hypothetical protein